MCPSLSADVISVKSTTSQVIHDNIGATLVRVKMGTGAALSTTALVILHHSQNFLIIARTPLFWN